VRGITVEETACLLVPTLRDIYELQTNSDFESSFVKSHASVAASLDVSVELVDGRSFNKA
jgi:hypothetical protein